MRTLIKKRYLTLLLFAAVAIVLVLVLWLLRKQHAATQLVNEVSKRPMLALSLQDMLRLRADFRPYLNYESKQCDVQFCEIEFAFANTPWNRLRVSQPIVMTLNIKRESGRTAYIGLSYFAANEAKGKGVNIRNFAAIHSSTPLEIYANSKNPAKLSTVVVSIYDDLVSQQDRVKLYDLNLSCLSIPRRCPEVRDLAPNLLSDFAVTFLDKPLPEGSSR